MIFPVPPKVKLIDLFEVYPWTLMLVFLNLLFFWMLFSEAPKAENRTDLSSGFATQAGHFYLEWQNQNQSHKTKMEMQAMGAVGIRDKDFVLALEAWKSKVDPVGFEKWKAEFNNYFKKSMNPALMIFGLSQMDNKPLTWITYQFSHQTAWHLISNLFFLFLFAAIVEKMVGGFFVGVIYLMGGLAGGWFFMRMDPSGLIPMVGASASVTALIGFVAAGSLKKNIEYFYFLSPFPGFYGQVFLSPLWVISLFMVEDIAQMLADPPGWGGGVAHSAHLGGAFAGLVLGLAFKWSHSRSAQEKA